MTSHAQHHNIVFLENFFLPTPVFDLPPGHTYDLTQYKYTSADELKERIKDADILIINRIPLSREVLSEEHSPRLRTIAVVASGTDSVDLEACRRRGITVMNSPECNTTAVAEHAIGLYFSVRRAIPLSHRLTQASEWTRRGLMLNSALHSPDGRAPLGCKDEFVGILGYGAVGKQIAALAKGLGMKVLISSRKGHTEAEEGRVPFEEVLRTATVIVVSLPRTPGTMNLISATELQQMQQCSVLVNVSRGGIVDEEALLQALEKGQIAGAATDVYATEPVSEDVSPLIGGRVEGLNLVTTPHSAWCAEQTNVNFIRTLQDNVRAWVLGEPTNVVT